MEYTILDYSGIINLDGGAKPKIPFNIFLPPTSPPPLRLLQKL